MNPLTLLKPDWRHEFPIDSEGDEVPYKFCRAGIGDHVVYLSIFEDESIITVFKGNEKIGSFAGSLRRCIQFAKQAINE